MILTYKECIEKYGSDYLLKKEIAEKIKKEGYSEANAEAKLSQDIIIYAISKSSFNRSVTIKGGVVMRSLSREVRRAT